MRAKQGQGVVMNGQWWDWEHDLKALVVAVVRYVCMMI